MRAVIEPLGGGTRSLGQVTRANGASPGAAPTAGGEPPAEAQNHAFAASPPEREPGSMRIPGPIVELSATRLM